MVYAVDFSNLQSYRKECTKHFGNAATKKLKRRIHMSLQSLDYMCFIATMQFTAIIIGTLKKLLLPKEETLSE